MSDFKWANPPAPKIGRHQATPGRFVAAGNKLLAKPGKWAQVRVFDADTPHKTKPSQRAANFADQVRKGKVAGLRSDLGTFEAVARCNGKDGVVYARFVPFS